MSVIPTEFLRKFKATDTEVMLQTHHHGLYIPVPRQALHPSLLAAVFPASSMQGLLLPAAWYPHCSALLCSSCLPSDALFGGTKGAEESPGKETLVWPLLVSHSINQLCPMCKAGTL